MAVEESFQTRLMSYILTNYRSIITVLILMPMSFLFEIYWQLKIWYILKFRQDPAKHSERVKSVQEQVKQWGKEAKGSKKMCTARPTWQTVSSKVATYKNKMYPIKVEMNDVLGIDKSKRVVSVEPGVTIGQLYKYLIPQGFTLTVNPELDELTVGGLINGYGIETSSHKWGLFSEVVQALDIVVPSGEVLHCDDKENTKIFRCVPWSYGTLGFLVRAELKIIPTKKYVKLAYIPCHSLEQFVKVYSDHQKKQNPHEFLEGIMYTRDEGVVTVGDFTDHCEKEYPIRWYTPYFFERCRYFLRNFKKDKIHTDYYPIMDYYRRHNRSIFWNIYDVCPASRYSWFRFAFGWMLPPRVPMLKWCQTETLAKFYEENYALQDFLVPLDKLTDIIETCHKELRVYPLWVCPMRVMKYEHDGFMIPKDKTLKPGQFEHFVDAATIGEPGLPIQIFDMEKAIRAVEDFMRECGGYQGNYGYTYQTQDQYRNMYNHKLYDQVRKEIGADVAFPEPYDKVGRKGFQTFSQGKIEKKMN